MKQETDSIEHLLKPRIKVTNDWPGSNVNVGDILYRFSDYSNGDYWAVKEGFAAVYYPEEFPHLFQKLEWWQEREESEMPKYVKWAGDGTIRTVSKWDLETTSAWFMYLENETRPYSPGGSALENSHWLPATRSEYMDYLKNNQ